jgi:hypothetical protein
MAKAERSKYFNFYILNIKLRKRTNQKNLAPEDYVRVMRKVHREKIHEESSPNKHCIFRFMFEEKAKNEVEYLSGTFAQFTFIQNERWFNLKSLDMDEEFKVPEGLFPDAKITDYVFIPKAHRFCYRTSADFNISPYAIRKFLEKALDKACRPDEFVQVDVESSKESIEAILSAREIKKLMIDINYSNVDIGSDLKKFVEEDIKASNTSRFQVVATQKPDVSIDVEQSTILSGALQSAISDGEAEAVIIDENNRTKRIKTSQFPRKESIYGVKSRFNQLVFEKIMRIFRNNGN